MFEPIRIEMPHRTKTDDDDYEDPFIAFKDFHKKIKAPVVIYGDFKTLIQKYSNIHNDKKVQLKN